MKIFKEERIDRSGNRYIVYCVKIAGTKECFREKWRAEDLIKEEEERHKPRPATEPDIDPDGDEPAPKLPGW